MSLMMAFIGASVSFSKRCGNRRNRHRPAEPPFCPVAEEEESHAKAPRTPRKRRVEPRNTRKEEEKRGRSASVVLVCACSSLLTLFRVFRVFRGSTLLFFLCVRLFVARPGIRLPQRPAARS